MQFWSSLAIQIHSMAQFRQITSDKYPELVDFKELYDFAAI